MHATIRAKDLARILTTVKPAVVSRTTIPILSSILLKAGEGTVAASACTLQALANDHAPADVRTPGAFAFPADALSSIVRSLPAETDVTLQPNDGDSRILITAGRTRARISVLPADDFPAFDSSAEHEGELPAEDLRRILVEPLFSTSTEETRWYLCGVNLVVREGKIVATATDGHRAFRAFAVAPAGLANMPQIIVPRDAQSAIAKILEGVDGAVRVGVSSARIVVTAGTRMYASKLVDGTFPDFDRVIPPLARKHTADVKRADLAVAVRRVLAVATDKTPLVAIKLAGNELRLRCSGDSHDSADAIDAEVTGGEIEIGLNGKYLLEQLDAMSGVNVALENETPGDPWRLIDEGRPDVHVIMPMRVGTR